MSRHATGRWHRSQLAGQVTVRDLIARVTGDPHRPEFGADERYAGELAAMRAELVEQDATDRLMGLPEAMLTEHMRPVAPPARPLAAATGVLTGLLDASWLAAVRAGGVA